MAALTGPSCAQDLCIGAVAANFHQHPDPGPLEDAAVGKQVVQRLPLDLPLELAGTVSGGARMRIGIAA